MNPTQALLPPVRRATLDNGLRIVLQPDPRLPLVAVNLWYHVGSKNERPGRTGLAHLFEHMLFQGSEHVGTNDHFRHVQQVGGVANGSTFYDRTNYYETLPSHHLELALWLESDRLGFLLPALTPEKLENQREVVSNERRQRIENQPYGRAFERLQELLFPAPHPYHSPVIGYMEDIAAATLADVEAFFRTYYAPNNLVLTLAGDFEPDAAIELVDRYFGPIPRGPRIPPVASPEPAETGELREVLTDEVRLSRVYLGFRCPPFGSRGWYAADLVATVLAGGKSSPLFQDLVHGRELAQDVSAFVLNTELAGGFYLVATARPGVEPAELEAGLVGHLEAAAAGPPAAPELERARNRLQTSYFEALQGLDQRADLLSQFTTLFDDPGRVETEMERYLGLTGEDLSAFAGEHLAAPERVTLTVRPREEGG